MKNLFAAIRIWIKPKIRNAKGMSIIPGFTDSCSNSLFGKNGGPVVLEYLNSDDFKSQSGGYIKTIYDHSRHMVIKVNEFYSPSVKGKTRYEMVIPDDVATIDEVKEYMYSHLDQFVNIPVNQDDD